MKEPYIGDFACLIGIDWADRKHDFCETDDQGKTYVLLAHNLSTVSLMCWISEAEYLHSHSLPQSSSFMDKKARRSV